MNINACDFIAVYKEEISYYSYKMSITRNILVSNFMTYMIIILSSHYNYQHINTLSLTFLLL